MLNLLFISDSPKAEYIKSVLQPVLKVIIDVVCDFDHGLKDVFEKRPATVCIQDQIGGVTGENVARHIQMLLGNSAPAFILLHSGNGKARLIKGLYEHCVDLSQSNETVAEDITTTLKTLLGEQWNKIYIPPKLTPALVRSSVAVPEESRGDADKLVDEFLTDLQSSNSQAGGNLPPAIASTPGSDFKQQLGLSPKGASTEPEKLAKPSAPAINQAVNIQSNSDEMADLLLAASEKNGRDEDLTRKITALANTASEPATTPKPDLPSAPPPSAVARVSGAPEVSSASLQLKKTPAPVSENKNIHVSAPPVQLNKPRESVIPQKTEQPTAPQPAKFVIKHPQAPEEELIPDDLFLAFEENYRPQPFYLKRSVIIPFVCVVVGVGGWSLFSKKPQLVGAVKQQIMPSVNVQPKAAPPVVPLPAPVQPQPPVQLPPVQAPVPPPTAQPSQPAQLAAPQPVKQVTSQPVQQPVKAASPLPSFVPKEGHDPAYTTTNPGWERYVGKSAEFRLFRATGQVKAVQVLVVNDAQIPQTMMKDVLQEFAGSPEYAVTSRSKKAGVRVEKGTIKNKFEILVYKKNGVIKAFVVSAN
jgi:hypothetical protein